MAIQCPIQCQYNTPNTTKARIYTYTFFCAMHECIRMQLYFAYSCACAPQYSASRGRGHPIHLLSLYWTLYSQTTRSSSSQQPLIYMVLVLARPNTAFRVLAASNTAFPVLAASNTAFPVLAASNTASGRLASPIHANTASIQR